MLPSIFFDTLNIRDFIDLLKELKPLAKEENIPLNLVIKCTADKMGEIENVSTVLIIFSSLYESFFGYE